MENKTDLTKAEETKRRILVAASEVFAEHGFADGTTREIAKRANANIAAISYYFGSKEQLYVTLLNYGKARVLQNLPLDKLQDAGIEPQTRLRLFVRSMLEKALDKETTLWFSKMVAREVLLEPDKAIGCFVDEDVKRVLGLLVEILRELCGDTGETETARLCAASVLSQCVFFTSSQLILQTVFQLPSVDCDNIDFFADHIVKFTLGAASALRG